jgi:Homeodomain-like domain
MEKYRVRLATDERVALEALLGKGKAAARRIAHARILLLADDSHGAAPADDEIASQLTLGVRTVARVRKRFVTEGFLAALDHKPQPPRPDKIKIKGDVEQQLIRLACSDPPEGSAHWTLQLLADELVVLGLTESVSTETVRQALKKTISNHGSSRRGAFRPMPTGNTSGEWKT